MKLYLGLFLSTLFLMYFELSFADTDCEEFYLPKQLISNFDSNVGCILNNKTGLTDRDLEVVRKHEFKVLFVKDLINIEASLESFSDTFLGKDFHLIVDGICAGECSRLLIPLAKSTSFTDGSFAVLNESSLKSRLAHGVEAIVNGSTEGDPFGTSDKKYSQEFGDIFQRELRIISTTQTNVTHLLWHSFLRRSTIASRSGCGAKKQTIILLTAEYYRENFIYVPDANVAKITQLKIDQVNKKIKDLFGNNAVLYTPFELRPVFSCFD